MSCLNLSLEEEFLEAENEYEGYARVDADTESSDVKNECSTYLHYSSL